jgi:leucyl-tRNA synthetase
MAGKKNQEQQPKQPNKADEAKTADVTSLAPSTAATIIRPAKRASTPGANNAPRAGGNGKLTARRAPARAASKSKHETDDTMDEKKARPPRYDFRRFEEKWRARWEESGIYRVDLRNAPRPYYNLMMFPYPSAEGLHVGNVYAFVGSDIHGRFMAAQGYDVFEPMGFDAFGIHSENFAIKRGVHPRALTAANVERFRERQLKRIGNRFDWSHEVNTTDPRYYKWTQWIFTQLFKAGLAERKKAAVNWCPKDKTVLADEQVIAGRCERCGTIVERRELEQWFLKTTAYADRLLNNLETLDWSERVKSAQRNWIGRSEGLEFEMAVTPGYGATSSDEHHVRVYTTRPDTIYGVTFVVLAPEHPLVDAITSTDRRDEVATYRADAIVRRSTSDASAAGGRPITGVFTGAHARHPLTGDQVPIWIADYVLMDYGTGAIMAVPAHDERDLAFAEAMGLPVRQVVEPVDARGVAAPAHGSPAANHPFSAHEEGVQGVRAESAAFTGYGVLVDSGPYTNMTSQEAIQAIIERFEAEGIGKRTVHYQMRDWLISRQRYWGPPVPIIYCPDHGAVAVPDDQLPVLLPELEDYQPTGTGDSPLSKIPEFVATTCPICGKPATRETDVMDNFLDSGWYYLRYPSSDDNTQAWDPEITRTWLPVAMYIGGAEHSVLHLLYTRFLTMALNDLGKLPFEEPFRRFRAHGLIIKDGAKMAKSAGNVINPDDYLETYGADVLRTYLMFMGPYEAGGDFSDRGIGGVVRFLERVWRLGTQPTAQSSAVASSAVAMHAAIKRVSEDIPALKYNTAIAALMEYVNALEAQPSVSRGELATLLVLLAPFAPYISEELWQRLGQTGSVHQQPWPAYNEAVLRRAVMTLVVQVDGRLRDRIELPAEASAEEVRTAVLAAEKVRRAIAGRAIHDVIYVPGRLTNVVTAD